MPNAHEVEPLGIERRLTGYSSRDEFAGDLPLRGVRSAPIMSDPTLRPAGPDDTETIATLWHSGWRDGHIGHVPEALLPHRHIEDFRKRVPPRIPETTVAVIAGQVVGFVTVREDELEQLYVAAAARGTGLANVLIRHAEEGIARRFEVAWLSVAVGNARARRFYERSGWRDAAAIDYHAEIAGGTIPVPCRRYEKKVASRQASSTSATRS